MAATSADEMESSAGRVTLPPWGFLDTLLPALDEGDDRVAAVRRALADGDASLRRRFEDDEPVEALVRDRARMVDVVLRHAWALHAGPYEKDVALIAVGGYGRGELHPCSDIDVLILLPKSEVGGNHDAIERFLAFLWDIGLEVGHSVRTLDDCQREALADVSVATTLIEARLLAGPEHLYAAMRRAFHGLRNGRPGPMVLDIPTDIGNSEVPDSAVPYTSPKTIATDDRDHAGCVAPHRNRDASPPAPRSRRAPTATSGVAPARLRPGSPPGRNGGETRDRRSWRASPLAVRASAPP